MQEQHRQRTREGGAGPGSGLFDDPGAAAGMATVTHGPYAEVLPIAEMTISQVRGNPADDATTVRAGQTLTFVRQSGEKGRS